jgi:hypothetical protein
MKDLLYIFTGVQDDGTQASTINLNNLSGSCDKAKSFINSSVYDARWQYVFGGEFTGAVSRAPTIFNGPSPTAYGYPLMSDITALNATRYDIAYCTEPTKNGWYVLNSDDPSIVGNWVRASVPFSSMSVIDDYRSKRDAFMIRSPVSDNPTSFKYALIDRFDDSLRNYTFTKMTETAKIVGSKFSNCGTLPDVNNFFGSTPDKIIKGDDVFLQWTTDSTSDYSLAVMVYYATVDSLTGAVTWTTSPYIKSLNEYYQPLDDGTSTMAFYNFFIRQETFLMSTFVNGVTSAISGVGERTRRSKWDTPSLNYTTQGHITFDNFDVAAGGTRFTHSRVLQPFKMKDAIYSGADGQYCNFPITTYYGANTNDRLSQLVPTIVTRDALLKSTYQLFEICVSNVSINHEGGSYSALSDVWLFNNDKGEHGDTVTIDSKTYVIWQNYNGIGRLAIRLG